ncbi:MAG: methyltransferase domain-containing protein [Rhodospirillaceae bacterium]|jgi:SAM-dependent methyltransferase|nr:methyltransferase domain-containing protein [Rhodospirillaceae bacterium]MBT3809145.1 methyltransferase domain-containing protein [Rhodospirillaceae bacterium]MBT3929406.1 methyltransferase domain-containing protein [Rhodospirillaceae bacterium]MBT4773709.1 methyltransferase domain-containing protein [Rhodospirillaceae bacterium]MBT5357635.1 methyltransferase domain-containing protein [Rhodospirillaceae bacterium]
MSVQHETTLACRFCGEALRTSFADLGETPLANSYLNDADPDTADPRYPLHARVCDSCFLVQVEDAVPAEEIFSDYAYFSSFSTSWVAHAEAYTRMATERFDLGPSSSVVEVASNDGYLLQHFVKAGIPVLGIEPAANVAKTAEANGVPTMAAFFGLDLATSLRNEGTRADLLLGNNVLAHVPDLNDFVAGLAHLLSEDGVLTMEFPHLARLIEDAQFDTIYHEHFSYFSLLVVENVFARHGLRLFDVEELPTHGGSLRIFASRSDGETRQEGDGLAKVRRDETAMALDKIESYAGFQTRVEAIRDGLLTFLAKARADGKTVAAYGAAAKGNTLLNYCGVDASQIDFVADVSDQKQGKFLPGSRIPIVAPERLRDTKPDFVLILPWNLKREITTAHDYIADWGGQFVVAVPELTFL